MRELSYIYPALGILGSSAAILFCRMIKSIAHPLKDLTNAVIRTIFLFQLLMVSHILLANIEIDDGGTTIENSDLGNVSGNLIVKSNSTYILNGNITNLTGNIEVESGSTLIINGNISDLDGSITINGQFTLTGSITADGKLEVKGSGVTTLDGGSFESVGSDIVIESGGVLNLTNMSTLTVASGKKVDNSGTINSDNSGNVINGDVGGSGTVDSDLGDCSSGCSDSVLPVDLLYFKSKMTNKAILLEWATASEENTQKFEIFRSYGDSNFRLWKEVPAHGTTTERRYYRITDENPREGIAYYQLKSVDFDGFEEWFPVEAVHFSHTDYRIYPNPSPNGLLNFSTFEKLDKIKVTVFDVEGKIHYQNSMDDFTNPLMDTRLEKGIYLIEIGNSTYRQIERLVIR